MDLLVWSSPAQVGVLDNFDTIRYLGTGGRFGWFLPDWLVTNESLALLEHWRTYTIENHQALATFHRSKQELEELAPLLYDELGRPHCSEPWCEGSVFTPARCRNPKVYCATLFASDAGERGVRVDDCVTCCAAPDTGGFLREQIEQEGLFVQVAYFGRNLTPELVRRNMQLSDGRSILVFHYTPSSLLEGLNFTSISFPPCKLEDSIIDYLCHYELHRFTKYIGSDLRIYARAIFDAIDSLALNSHEFTTLLSEYSLQYFRNYSYSQVACKWLQKYDYWRSWRFVSMPDNLYLIGFFPVKSADVNNGDSDANTATNNGTSVQSRKPSKPTSYWFAKNKFIAPGNVPSFHLAVENINNNRSILPEYRLVGIALNDACERDLVMAQFINVIKTYAKSNYLKNTIGIIGPACSDTLVPLAGVQNHFKIPVISYGAEGAIFSDQEEYPYFFRTIPENKIYRHVFLELFRELGWTRIASITEEGQRYAEYVTPLREVLEQNGMVFFMRKYRPDSKSLNLLSHLEAFKLQRSTVIIGDLYEDVARVIMCLAYHHEMTARHGYVWFLPQWYSENWFNKTEKGDESLPECTYEQMMDALDGHMSLSYQYFGDDNQTMQTNKTVGEWHTQYEKEVNLYNTSPSDYAGFTYDAVWSLAYALDKMAKKDQSLMVNLRSERSAEAIIGNLESLKFNGVSGEVSFQNSHSRVTDLVVRQFARGKHVEVAKFLVDAEDETKNKLVLYKSKLSWPGDFPKDKLEPCMIEGFRYVLGTSCLTSIILLCIIVFGIAITFPLACLYIMRRKYERKVKELQAMWTECNVFNMFNGCQIRRDNLVLNRRIGEGQFGIIYGGECNIEGHGWIAVAVKTLKPNSTIAEKKEFLSEANLMRTLQHENLVKLIGVCLDSEPIQAVMEFMLYGDLQKYLLARRNLVYNSTRNDNDEVSNFRLTSMVKDVAKGLQFLADNKYVHRDLACRNCLVNVNKTVKIADFGMTRPVFETNYYRINHKAMVPVRWMAPEYLKEGFYSPMSDMWSYGVLLYEVITFGAIPFQNMNNDQVLEYVKEQNTLTVPPNIDPLLEDLLLKCWQICPSRRPTAQQVVHLLNNHPMLVSPSLDSPQTCVSVDEGNTAPLQPVMPRITKPTPTSTSLTRRLSLHPQRHGNSQNGVLSHPSVSMLHNSRQSSLSSSSSQNHAARNNSGSSSSSGALFSNGRKRSMSGNMAVPPITCSLSDTTIGDYRSPHQHNTLDALNLSINAVVVEERSEDGDHPGANVGGDDDGNIGEDGEHQSGDSSGYASTGTGTGGSSSSKRTEPSESASNSACRSRVNPNRSVMAGCISSRCPPAHSKSRKMSVFGVCPEVKQRALDFPSCSHMAPGEENMFYLSDSDRTLRSNSCSSGSSNACHKSGACCASDESAIPLLDLGPESLNACKSTDRSNAKCKSILERRRTPTVDLSDDPLKTIVCKGLCTSTYSNKSNSSSTSSTSSSSTTTSAAPSHA
ncbi:Receptor ligand binding region [Trinorchestia longiramus]|nr:Receptor ligand binding region [Trinorchestia longiramus]